MRLRGSGVGLVAAVGYPLGAGTVAVMAAEARQALRNGATEVDLVANAGAVRSRDVDRLEETIAKVSEACREHAARLKVIIEADLLTDDEIRMVLGAVVAGRADFVKTASGFGGTGSCERDVLLIRAILDGDDHAVDSLGEDELTRIGASVAVPV